MAKFRGGCQVRSGPARIRPTLRRFPAMARASRVERVRRASSDLRISFEIPPSEEGVDFDRPRKGTTAWPPACRPRARKRLTEPDLFHQPDEVVEEPFVDNLPLFVPSGQGAEFDLEATIGRGDRLAAHIHWALHRPGKICH